jgi:hypothetical protein
MPNQPNEADQTTKSSQEPTLIHQTGDTDSC